MKKRGKPIAMLSAMALLLGLVFSVLRPALALNFNTITTQPGETDLFPAFRATYLSSNETTRETSSPRSEPENTPSRSYPEYPGSDAGTTSPPATSPTSEPENTPSRSYPEYPGSDPSTTSPPATNPTNEPENTPSRSYPEYPGSDPSTTSPPATSPVSEPEYTSSLISPDYPGYETPWASIATSISTDIDETLPTTLPSISETIPTSIRETPSEPVPSISYPIPSEPGISDDFPTPSDPAGIRMIQETPIWVRESLEPVIFTSNARFADFVCVKINGLEIDRAHYDVSEGSTIIWFKPAYLKTLTIGKHQVEIVSTTGIARSMIEIKAPASQNPVKEAAASDTAPTPTDTLPRTGRTGEQQWPALVLLLTGIMLLALLTRRITRQRS